MDVLPGDAASTIARTTDPATVDAVRSRLGLDDPLLVRLGEWATALFLHGDGGHLYASGIPVWEAAASSARNSTYLVACALPLLLLIGILSGVFAGLRPTALRDHILSTGAQTTLATPDFAVTTVLLVLCAGVLHLAPAVSLVPPGGTPLDRPDSLIVPALAIALVGGAWLQRLVRAAIVDAAALPPHSRRTPRRSPSCNSGLASHTSCRSRPHCPSMCRHHPLRCHRHRCCRKRGGIPRNRHAHRHIHRRT